MAVISQDNGLKMYAIPDNSRVDPQIQELQLSLEKIEKGGYDHFMLKEIYEQPEAIIDTFAEDFTENNTRFYCLDWKNTKKCFKTPSESSSLLVAPLGMQALWANICLKMRRVFQLR